MFKLYLQTRLLQYTDIFLNVMSGDLGPSVGILLQEIFRGGPTISLAVKEGQIQKMLQSMLAKGKETAAETNSALAEALQELVLV